MLLLLIIVVLGPSREVQNAIYVRTVSSSFAHSTWKITGYNQQTNWNTAIQYFCIAQASFFSLATSQIHSFNYKALQVLTIQRSEGSSWKSLHSHTPRKKPNRKTIHLSNYKDPNKTKDRGPLLKETGFQTPLQALWYSNRAWSTLTEYAQQVGSNTCSTELTLQYWVPSNIGW